MITNLIHKEIVYKKADLVHQLRKVSNQGSENERSLSILIFNFIYDIILTYNFREWETHNQHTFQEKLLYSNESQMILGLGMKEI